MNKEQFLQLFGEIIFMMGNIDKFQKDDKLIFERRQITLEDLGHYYCPWYYDYDNMRGYVHVPFEAIKDFSSATAVKMKDVESNIRFPSKESKINQYIKDFQGKTEESLRPFPIATDVKFNKSLILDGNHTLVALYKTWDKSITIPIVEIRGDGLAQIFLDFDIVYKS